MELLGLHHVSAMTAQAAKNVEFYTRVMGMRLVKKTVNQDDTSSYHLFYGDEIGNPGTELTFFDIPHAAPTRPGVSSISRIGLRVTGREALDYWADRLAEHGVEHDGITTEGGRAVLPFRDFEGQRLALMDDQDAAIPGGTPWAKSTTPQAVGIRGLGSVTLTVRNAEPTVRVLTDLLGFRQQGSYRVEEGAGRNVLVLETGAGGPGSEVHVDERRDLPPERLGRGGVHHVASASSVHQRFMAAWSGLYLKFTPSLPLHCEALVQRRANASRHPGLASASHSEVSVGRPRLFTEMKVVLTVTLSRAKGPVCIGSCFPFRGLRTSLSITVETFILLGGPSALMTAFRVTDLDTFIFTWIRIYLARGKLSGPHRRVFRGTGMLTHAPSMAREANTLPGNPWPSHLTRFIGREREMAEVLRRLGETRLLTLTGPGGSGKTRLATELARALHVSPSKADDPLYPLSSILYPLCPDGIWWIDLAALSDGSLVSQAVASALGIREQPGRRLSDTLLSEMASRQALLIFDNCEHLIEACASLALSLLGACPGLRILATSREPLGVLGETVWPVPSLSVPSAAQSPQGEYQGLSRGDPQPLTLASHLSGILDSDAVRLFVERARQASPGFTLTPDNAEAVAHICRRLDGIPLALELAAARVRILNVNEMATRLDDLFRLLAGAPRNLPPRHQTLRATVDWSYHLLAETERRLFRRLAVFAGGFSLAAAEAVCVDAPDTGQDALWPTDIIDLLTRLVDKSLVTVDTPTGSETRYRLLETIRQYARDRLGDETHSLRQRHLAWCVTLVEQAEPELYGPRLRQWLAWLERDHDNLRAALAFGLEDSVSQPSSDSILYALRLAGAIGWFWTLRGYLSEGRRWLEALLHATQSPSPDHHPLKAARARALHGAGILAVAQGDLAAASAFLQDALALTWALGDPRLIARTLMTMGAGVVWQGQPAAARRLLEQSLTFFRQTDDRWGTAAALAWLGEVSRGEGHYAQARQEYDESLRLFETIGDDWGECWPLIGQAHLALQQGDYSQAGALYDHCLAIFREFGERWGQGAVLNGIAEVARGQGEVAQAIQMYYEALAVNRQIGFQYGAALSLTGLALCVTPSQPERAAQLLSAAFALMARQGAQMDPSRQAPVEQAQATLQQVLGDEAYGLAWTQGRALTLDQATDLAHRLDTPLTSAQPTLPPVVTSPSPLPSTLYPLASDDRLRLLALGPTQVYRDGQPLAASAWTYTKPKELLFYLLSHGRQTKEQIGLALWPDASSSQLRSNFRTALYHLRRALGDTGWILFEEDHYSFNRSLSYWYDAEVFEKELKTVLASQGHATDSARPSLSFIVSLYRGDFLADVEGGEWLDFKREEMRRLYLEALMALGAAQFGQAHYSDAAGAYRRALTQDSYLEAAHRELMRCLARLGEPGQALRHYQSLVQLLSDELGAPPAPETTALYHRLRQGDTDI